ncbi:MAG: hypothetical protein FWD50_03000 [Betaproteobacteria bacterium]|nr:hypothetical protein [Betaproteobacteria bacterium]
MAIAQQLSTDTATQVEMAEIFRPRAAHLLKTRPEIAQLLWPDPLARPTTRELKNAGELAKLLVPSP